MFYRIFHFYSIKKNSFFHKRGLVMNIENITDLPQTKYRIGDVAELIGMSRDSLRYYEKRGLLPSKKEDNGYRYYTEEDLGRLISILYQRKMGLGLDKIALGFQEFSSDQSKICRMREQLAREKEEIREHQRAIARLQMSLEDYELIHRHSEEIIAKDFPASYVILPETGFSEGITQWFRLASRYPGLDMMYVFDSYAWNRNGDEINLHYQKSLMILKKEFRDFVEYPFSETSTPLIESFPCLCAFSNSRKRLPPEEQVRALLDTAKAQGLTPGPELYCTFIGKSEHEEQIFYELQLYLPVAQK